MIAIPKRLVLLAAGLIANAAIAEETDVAAQVSLELNATKTTEDSCTLTFLVVNGHAHQIDNAVYETVLFDNDGQVDRMTLFDFGALPAGRPRVRQFAVSGTTCEQLGQVLINGAHACSAPALPEGACETDLQVGTRTDIEVTG